MNPEPDRESAKRAARGVIPFGVSTNANVILRVIMPLMSREK